MLWREILTRLSMQYVLSSYTTNKFGVIQYTTVQSACNKKNTVGKMKLIETILSISSLGFSMFRQFPHDTQGINFCELLLETWSTLWNITGNI